MTRNYFDEEPTNVGAITTVAVLAGAPVLMVSHDDDDGGWQFLCGTTEDPADARVVHLRHIVEGDPTLVEVSDLPFGWCAFRLEVGGPWKREPV